MFVKDEGTKSLRVNNTDQRIILKCILQK